MDQERSLKQHMPARTSSAMNVAINVSRTAVLITRQPLDPGVVEMEVRDSSSGAVVTFVGVTRNQHAGRNVQGLEYEAHEAMAGRMLQKLCEEAIQKFGLVRVRIHHRLGRLHVGDPSVVIAVSSPHRGAAFDGCRYLIDTLKATIPIFKKEHYADGSEPQWVRPDGKTVEIPT